MAIKAVWRLRTLQKVYEPGEMVTGLSCEEEEDLILSGAAIYAAEDTKKPESSIPVLDALRLVLIDMTKKELISYAKDTDVDVSEQMKKDDIIGNIIQDADQRGIDTGSMENEQLIAFASVIGIKSPDQMDREDLLDAVEDIAGVQDEL